MLDALQRGCGSRRGERRRRATRCSETSSSPTTASVTGPRSCPSSATCGASTEVGPSRRSLPRSVPAYLGRLEADIEAKLKNLIMGDAATVAARLREFEASASSSSSAAASSATCPAKTSHRAFEGLGRSGQEVRDEARPGTDPSCRRDPRTARGPGRDSSCFFLRCGLGQRVAGGWSGRWSRRGRDPGQLCRSASEPSSTPASTTPCTWPRTSRSRTSRHRGGSRCCCACEPEGSARYDSPVDQDWFEEQLQVFAAALSGAHIQWSGEHLSVPARIDANQPAPDRLALNPRPAQPAVPIWVESSEKWMDDLARRIVSGCRRVRDPQPESRRPQDAGRACCSARTTSPPEDLLARPGTRPAISSSLPRLAADVESAGRRLAGRVANARLPGHGSTPDRAGVNRQAFVCLK